MKQQSSREKTQNIVRIALLSAIVVTIQLLFSNLTIGPVTLSFTLIPIVIAGTLISPVAGLIVGAVSGITTFIQVLTSANVFYVFLIGTNPLATALICLTKTSAAGYLSGLFYRLITKSTKKRTLGAVVSAAACPIINTGIFCLGMFTFFANALMTDSVFGADASAGLVAFVFIGLAGINFVVELILNLVLCPVISEALHKVYTRK